MDLNTLKQSKAIESNIEAMQAQIKTLQAPDDREMKPSTRERRKRLIMTLESEIDRNRKMQAAYNDYLANIEDKQIKRMLELYMNGISWAKIYAIIYGYPNGGTGANYCYVTCKRYLKKHPMKGQ